MGCRVLNYDCLPVKIYDRPCAIPLASINYLKNKDHGLFCITALFHPLLFIAAAFNSMAVNIS